jgi:nicotinate phosphoribosyltransferase
MKLERLIKQQAPIDGFGIGTHMDTSADAPYLDCAYKLVEYAGKARRKRSEGKVLWPGRKQVFRRFGEDGRIHDDTLTIERDRQGGEALLLPVMKEGRRIGPDEQLESIRERVLDSLNRLPEPLRKLAPAPAYPVKVSDALENLAHELELSEAALAEGSMLHRHQ